jgi:hypothetical protein
MGRKLKPEEQALYKRTDEVLHYLWDPIGISDTPEARDEYYSYLPQVFKMLMESKPNNEIVDYLLYLESERLGLISNRKKADQVVQILVSWRNNCLKNSV